MNRLWAQVFMLGNKVIPTPADLFSICLPSQSVSLSLQLARDIAWQHIVQGLLPIGSMACDLASVQVIQTQNKPRPLTSILFDYPLALTGPLVSTELHAADTHCVEMRTGLTGRRWTKLQTSSCSVSDLDRSDVFL